MIVFWEILRDVGFVQAGLEVNIAAVFVQLFFLSDIPRYRRQLLAGVDA